jgi:hypothetical protein
VVTSKQLVKFVLVLMLGIFVSGCTPPERVAYETIVAAKAFTDKAKSQHPECAMGTTSSLCTNLTRAVSAKDALIDAAEVYCAGPDFNSGSACNPSAKGTPAYAQALAKMQAATAAYSQTAADLKGAL